MGISRSLLEAEIAAGENAYQPAIGPGDRQARHVVLVHDLAGVAEGGVRRQGGRVEDDAVGAALDLLDLFGLAVDGKVLVDDADAPLWARAIAISLSVTVSMGELSNGILRRIRDVSWVLTSTSAGTTSL